jgi:hypothetical protein
MLTSNSIVTIIGSRVHCTHQPEKQMTSEFTEATTAWMRCVANSGSGNQMQELLTNLADQIDTMNAITKTRGPSATSFNSQVADLRPGESISKVRAVDPTITVARLPAEMPSIRTQARNAVAPAVTRAKELTGSSYTVETGDVIMPGGSMYVVVVITRLDD